MKKQTKKTLVLNKVTIQDLQNGLNREEQNALRGGSVTPPHSITDIKVYC